MALTQNTSGIINLCSAEDCKKVIKIQGSCEVYWPQQGKSSKFSNIEVETLQETEKSSYISRDLQLNHENSSKKIKFLQYLAWPDKSVPKDSQGIEEIIKEVAGIMDTGKVIVHCSAGVGRTGTFIALYNLKRCIDDQFICKVDFGVSVFSAVRRLREQRMHMVQTVEQYEFIHDLVEKWIDEWNVKNEEAKGKE